MSRNGRVFIFILFMGSALGVTLLQAVAVDESPGDAPQGTESEQAVEVRYAEAFLRLQLAKQKKAAALNRRVAHTISDMDMQILQLNVGLGKQLLKSALREGTRRDNSVFLRLAENSVLTAESSLAKANVARQNSPRAVSDVDVEILQIQVELAKVNLETGKEALAGTTEDELRWKVGMLYEEILQLRDQVKQLSRRR